MVALKRRLTSGYVYFSSTGQLGRFETMKFYFVTCVFELVYLTLFTLYVFLYFVIFNVDKFEKSFIKAQSNIEL